MFHKKVDRTHQRGEVEDDIAIIAKGMYMEGNITPKSTKSPFKVHVLGSFDGNIDAEEVIIGKEGNACGTIKSNHLVIKGHFQGQVSASKVTIQEGAIVSGKIEYNILVITNADVSAELVKRNSHAESTAYSTDPAAPNMCDDDTVQQI